MSVLKSLAPLPLLFALSCSPVQEASTGALQASGLGVEGFTTGALLPSDGTPVLLADIELTNVSEVPVVFEAITPSSLHPAVRVVGFRLIEGAQGSESLKHSCGPFPPASVPTLDVPGAILQPGETFTVLVGLVGRGEPFEGPQGIKGLQVAYRTSGDSSVVQTFSNYSVGIEYDPELASVATRWCEQSQDST